MADGGGTDRSLARAHGLLEQWEIPGAPSLFLQEQAQPVEPPGESWIAGRRRRDSGPAGLNGRVEHGGVAGLLIGEQQDGTKVVLITGDGGMTGRSQRDASRSAVAPS